MATSNPESTSLARGHISRASLIAMAISSVLPTVALGLFPALAFGFAGPAAWVSSAIAGVAILFVGICVTLFARRVVATGSLYSYIGLALGPWARYLMAAGLLVSFVTAVAAITLITGLYFGSFLLGQGVENALLPVVQIPLLIASVGVGWAVVHRGIDMSVRVAVGLAVVSLPLIVVITIASAMKNGLALDVQLQFSSIDWTGVAMGMAVGTLFLLGFDACASLASEAKEPRKSVPYAVMAVPVILGVLLPVFTILQMGGLMEVTDQLDAGMSGASALALQAGLGQTVAVAIDLVLGVAGFSAMIGFMSYGARFLKTLAEDGLLWKRFAEINPKQQTPDKANAFMAFGSISVAILFLLIFGNTVDAYSATGPMVSYAWILPYILICIGAIVLTVRERGNVVLYTVSGVLGAAGVALTYVFGVIEPPLPPANNMMGVTLIVLVVVGVALFITRKASKVTTWSTGKEYELSDEPTVDEVAP